MTEIIISTFINNEYATFYIVYLQHYLVHKDEIKTDKTQTLFIYLYVTFHANMQPRAK